MGGKVLKKPFAKLLQDQKIFLYKRGMTEKAKKAMQERILRAWNSGDLWRGK